MLASSVVESSGTRWMNLLKAKWIALHLFQYQRNTLDEKHY